MKKKAILILLILFYFISFSQTNSSTRSQRGYYKKNGTFVQSHYKTTTNKTNHDNYSTKGNRNLYTGKKGSKARDYSSNANNYIHTGENCGQYYVNSKGKKTYVPKR